MMQADCHFCGKLASLATLPAEEVVWQFPNALALLGPWQFYTGYCILVARTHVRELHHMSDAVRRGYFEEMCLLSRAIETAVQPLKLNQELLGNQVPHVHWHLFPRFADDPERLRPVWLALDRAEHDPAEKQRLQSGRRNRMETTRLLRQHLEALGAPTV